MAKISRAVRDACRVRLADPVTGFTPRLTTALASAGLAVPAGFKLPIDFTSSSKNFAQADVKPDQIEATSTRTYPFLTLFTSDSANENFEKYPLFAGRVVIGIGFHIAWMPNRVLYDSFEVFADCVEEALFGTFNDPVLNDWAQPDALWNGELSLAREPLRFGLKNWTQSLYARLPFEKHVMAA